MIEVGSIITAYQSGYHVVVDMVPYEGQTALTRAPQLLVHRRIYDGTARPRRGTNRRCSTSYCAEVTAESLTKEIEEIMKHVKRLEEMRRNLPEIRRRGVAVVGEVRLIPR